MYVHITINHVVITTPTPGVLPSQVRPCYKILKFSHICSMSLHKTNLVHPHILSISFVLFCFASAILLPFNFTEPLP